MQVVVSLIVLSVSLFIILSQHYDGKNNQWAYGMAGMVLGFWLKK